MKHQPTTPIVFFAQVPPPEHGQSRMVMLALEILRKNPDLFDIHHVNARFSSSLEEIGESSLGKMLLTAKYLYQAIRIRVRVKQPVLYYIPGPVKWSSILRDWVLLSILRCFYSRVVFHWHAIGHGEWAHGSVRLALEGPRWVDRIARKISACVLENPHASIAVSDNSQKDSHAVSSKQKLVICNGIENPCPGFEENLATMKFLRQQEIAAAESPCFRILFLSHGTLEKGIIDALDCLSELLKHCDPSWRFHVTFAGGVSDLIRINFNAMVSTLLSEWPDRISIIQQGYLTGADKHQCFADHDIFLASSRWESFGLTVIEAMAYGMPIVAAASDGVTGVLPDDYPYLAPVMAPEKLAEKMMLCCSAYRKNSDITEGRKLRKRFLSFYQIKNFSENLVEAFLEIRAKSEANGLEIGNSQHTFEIPSPSLPLAPSGRAQRSRPTDDLSLATPSLLTGHYPPATSSFISISAYLADQNPGHDRSFGISRMSQVVLEALQAGGKVKIKTIASKTSQQAPGSVESAHILPWGTRRKWVRLLTDHFHPLFNGRENPSDMYYFPKGYLPLLDIFSRPSVVTIHDTIIQYDEDHYPKWRSRWEYGYWATMLKHTLRKANRILTVSEFSKQQITDFMDRHRIPRKEITVTYEPCLYEKIPQPENPAKENYVIHLASCEPHKRTAHLIRWWHEAEKDGRTLPTLHLIGNVPPDVEQLLASSHGIVKRPFLDDDALQSAYVKARALILPSEIEGFGLPALEAYYLGTPVCFVKGTSVEEILGVATNKGAFSLESARSLFTALDEVTHMSPEEVRNCGLKLRETYASEKVAERMISVFEDVRSR